MFEVCGADGIVRGECFRCPLKVKVTGQKDGHCLARGGGGGVEESRYDYKNMKKHAFL